MFSSLTLQLRPIALIAAFGAMALATSANAATVSLKLTSSLPTASGSINSINFGSAGAISSTGFTVNSGATSGSVTISSNGGSVVSGSVAGAYSAPTAAGSSTYLSTGGTPNSITLAFSSLQSYLGLDWGTVGTGDSLSFYNGTTLIQTFLGTDLIAAGATQNQDAFAMFNLSGGQFTSVVLAQNGGPSFEASNFEYSTKNVPEPTSIALAGAALLGCFAVRRKS